MQLGSNFYHNADVTLTFYADTKDVIQFATQAPDGNTGSGFLVDRGRATVHIRTVSGVVRATFAPRQVFVSLDTANNGVGFSSYVGSDHHVEPAYPLGLDDLGAGSWNGLTTATNISGNAWSCIGFPPSKNPVGDCLDPTPYPLSTDQGDFFIFNAYEGYRFNGALGPSSGTLNRGIFSVVLSPPDE